MTRAYWWRAQPNWGDRLNWTILHKLGHDPEWAQPLQADLVLMGSIIEHIPPVFTGTVCGAGKMFEDSHPDLSRAKVLAVRGKLTAAGCRGIPKDVTLGDPPTLDRQNVVAPLQVRAFHRPHSPSRAGNPRHHVLPAHHHLVPAWCDCGGCVRHPETYRTVPRSNPECSP